MPGLHDGASHAKCARPPVNYVEDGGNVQRIPFSAETACRSQYDVSRVIASVLDQCRNMFKPGEMTQSHPRVVKLQGSVQLFREMTRGTRQNGR